MQKQNKFMVHAQKMHFQLMSEGQQLEATKEMTKDLSHLNTTKRLSRQNLVS